MFRWNLLTRRLVLPGSRSANTKWQSIYPGIAISVTVEGAYQNLRRFIRDLETTKQFIIINSVELERSNETNYSPATQGEPTSGARGALISLRLEMTTYFKRASAQDARTLRPINRSMQVNDIRNPAERNKLILAGALGIVAILFLWWTFFGFGSSNKVSPRPSGQGTSSEPRFEAQRGATDHR